MRIGVVLPSFTASAAPALQTARRAESLGLSGVFVYDHLFPIGGPRRPALHALTLLGAVASATQRVTVAPLVARISLQPVEVLVHAFETLAQVSAGRFVAALGLGDRSSEPEHRAYGLPLPPLGARVAALETTIAALNARRIACWVGGTGGAARRLAATATGWNVWNVPPDTLTAVARPDLVRTWAGPCLIGTTSTAVADRRRARPTLPGPEGTAAVIADHARSLAAHGATWAIYAPPDVADAPDVLEALADVQDQVRDLCVGSPAGPPESP